MPNRGYIVYNSIYLDKSIGIHRHIFIHTQICHMMYSKLLPVPFPGKWYGKGEIEDLYNFFLKRRDDLNRKILTVIPTKTLSRI